MAHQFRRTFEKPKGFKDLETFEQLEMLNSVQINVFKYEKQPFFGLRMSKHFDYSSELDLFLLQEKNF